MFCGSAKEVDAIKARVEVRITFLKCITGISRVVEEWGVLEEGAKEREKQVLYIYDRPCIALYLVRLCVDSGTRNGG